MIRRATAADVFALAELESNLLGADAWSAEALGAEIVAATRRWTVLTDDLDGVVGYAVLAVIDETADLVRLGVRRDRQRRGLASELVTDAATAARDLGAERMLLEVSEGNEAARAFYFARGFVEIDRRRRYYQDGSDAVVLSRNLLG